MKDPNQWSASTEHEGVYHTARSCQAASLPLTASGLRGQKKACSVESEKTKGGFAAHKRLLSFQWMSNCSSSPTSVLLLCRLKDCRLIRLRLLPHRIDYTDPHIGEGTHGNTMAFSLLAFALVIRQGPGLRLRGLPGKLMQSVAQGLHTCVASMNSGIGPALEDHRSRAGQRLQFRDIGITLPVITDFCRASEEPSAGRHEAGFQRSRGLHDSKKAG